MTTLNELRTQFGHGLRLLGNEDKAQVIGLFFAIFLMAILEVAGIASILPFMYLVSQPDVIQSNSLLHWAYETFGFSSQRNMLIAAGALVLVLFSISTAFTAFTTWLIHRTVWSIAHRVSMRLLSNYGRVPYEFFLAHDSSELLKKVLSDVSTFVSGVVAAALRFAAYASLSGAIFIFLLAAKPVLALAALVIFGGAHALFQLMLHGYFRRLGEERLRVSYDRYRTFSETVTGIKAIRTEGVYPFFVDRFRTASERYAELHPRYELVAMLPRFAIELLAFGAIIVTVIYWLIGGEVFIDKIPILTLFALAAYRLLPALNKASDSFSQLSHNLPVINEVYSDFCDETLQTGDISKQAQTKLAFDDSIEVHRIGFQYQSSHTAVLSDVSIKVPKGARVALVGATGSGKSTLIDILVGLLIPVDGAFTVDGKPVTLQNAAAWRDQIAYVPQDIFLYNDSITRNIAFGVPDDQIDKQRVRDSARIAQIDNFVSNELNEGYATVVGERGVRLSGGQRQRIGLARAFYRQPCVLLLDEATSALDGATEAAVMTAMGDAFPAVTVIMIAHRLSTVKDCDRIFMVDQGKIIASGSYDYLLDTSNAFRRLVELGAKQSDGR